jgi:hypothetical protein
MFLTLVCRPRRRAGSYLTPALSRRVASHDNRSTLCLRRGRVGKKRRFRAADGPANSWYVSRSFTRSVRRVQLARKLRRRYFTAGRKRHFQADWDQGLIEIHRPLTHLSDRVAREGAQAAASARECQRRRRTEGGAADHVSAMACASAPLTTPLRETSCFGSPIASFLRGAGSTPW